MEYVKVAAGSNVKDVAWVITQELREKEWLNVQAIGAGAVNQMVKAIIIARGYLAPGDIGLACVPHLRKWIAMEAKEQQSVLQYGQIKGK